MKKILFITMTALLTLAACSGGTKPTTDGNKAGTEAKSKYNPTDARAFGLLGPVKTVNVDICKLNDVADGEDPWVEKDMPLMAFNRHGCVTLDPMGNTYEYDSQGKVIKGVRAKVLVKRDDLGHITRYESRDGDNDREMRSIEFRYDAQGRLIAADRCYWEELFTDSMVYEEDKVYPAKKICEGQSEADEYVAETVYTYDEFDEQGNWTKRHLKETVDNVIARDESTRTKETFEQMEVRHITYYTEEELNASEDSEANAKSSEETAVDVKAFGFIGPVKEAFSSEYDVKDFDADKLEPEGEPRNTNQSEQGYAFNKAGQITIDPWGGIYEYDADGQFVRGITAKTKMKRDDKQRVVFYRQANDEDDDAMFKNEFVYDEQGRLKKVSVTFWESSQEEEFFYEGDNIYPSRREYSAEEEGTEWKSSTEYIYTKFDDRGNWIEREKHLRGSEKVGDEEGGTTSWRDKTIEKRTVEYY